MKVLFFISALGLLLLTGCATKHGSNEKTVVKGSGYSIPVNEESVAKIIDSWPAQSQKASRAMIKKYGLPNMVSDEMVIWYDSGPFKRSVVTKEETPHAFPYPHLDVLQQTINYRVPQDKVNDLTLFDGSLLVDRTKGELSARSDGEEMNFLSLNLADKIVRGEMKVADAREKYTRVSQMYASGTTSRLLTALRFKIEGDTTAPDRKLIQAQEAVDAVEDSLQR